ncbi:hypothetical protein JXA88_12210 [Candidatus Fermentibacteria bacterium]|nr:hypothetical protein [Candidatus Fermentibacteria bacterium]
MREWSGIVRGLLIVALWGMAVVHAEIPQMISYQGKVTDSGGTPVADASYPMRFQIYDAETGGTQLWDSGPQTVAVSGGVFSVVLGAGSMPALGLAFNEDHWLQVYFNLISQSPRQRLVSVGYAYMASGLVAGTEVSGSLPGSILAAFNSNAGADASALRASSTPSTGFTHGLYAECHSPNGSGVFARNYGTPGEAHAVFAQTLSIEGRAIYAQAPNAGGYSMGVHAVAASPISDGIHGTASAASGNAYGVYGESASSEGCGVFGYASATSGDPRGVEGYLCAPDGYAVMGQNNAVSGSAWGVFGQTNSTDGRAVQGVAEAIENATTYGVYGLHHAYHGAGVYGETTGGFANGVQGKAGGFGYGVYGVNTAAMGGCGVVGEVVATTGTSALGVYGLVHVPGGGFAVYGKSEGSIGVSYGVYGQNCSPSGYGVYYQGNLAGSGTKSCVVRTSKGPTLLYCQESPENWFEDFGHSRLADGRAHVELDEVFLETVTIDDANPMMVFVQLGGECEGVYVSKSDTGFDVVEFRGGASNLPFDYRVVAKRRGYEAKRLDLCEAARTDSYLYPEAADRQHVEQERAREDYRAQLSRERPTAMRDIVASDPTKRDLVTNNGIGMPSHDLGEPKGPSIED